jgi:hypothetical protein
MEENKIKYKIEERSIYVGRVYMLMALPSAQPKSMALRYADGICIYADGCRRHSSICAHSADSCANDFPSPISI